MTLPVITAVLTASCCLCLSFPNALGQRGPLPLCSSHLAALPHLHKAALQAPPQRQATGAAEMHGGKRGRSGAGQRAAFLRGEPPWTPSSAAATPGAQTHQSLCKPQKSYIFTPWKHLLSFTSPGTPVVASFYHIGRK